jgi:hypothetical protein
MATDHWAIIVGVWLYPGLENLHGPENDAVAFAEWLKRPDGGNVPPEQVKLILSSDFQPFATADTAQPTRDRIEAAFDELDVVARQNQAANRGRRVGGRLYLYFGGHGFAPVQDEAALLSANSTQSNMRYHIPGKSWANWFFTANYFDDVVLFMDCCRSMYPNWPVNPAGYGPIIGPRQGMRFFGFGTKWRRVSWERPMPDGKVHGVFTTALLTGLQGAAADPNTGQVTAKTLREYLLNYMRNFLAPEDRENPDVDPEPDIPDLDNAGNDLVFVQLAPPSFKVTVQPSANAAGKNITIMDHKFTVVESTTMPAGGVVPWTVRLKRGRYLAQVVGDGQGEPFDVSGTEHDPPGQQVNV